MTMYRTMYGESVSDIPYSAVSGWAGMDEDAWQALVDVADGKVSRRLSEAHHSIVSDDGVDGVFDGMGDSLDAAVGRINVGEYDRSSDNQINRLIVKYPLPKATKETPVLEKAVLRGYLNRTSGTPAGPVSVFHSEEDNELLVDVSDYEDPNFVDTMADLFQPSDPSGFYEIDVTEIVRGDYAVDGSAPLSAFRFEISDATFVEDNKRNVFDMSEPQLIVSFASLPDLTDFNGDAIFDALDIDSISVALRSNNLHAKFDVNQDGRVTSEDRAFLIESVAATNPGDSNLDGNVDFADFLVLSNSFNENGGWAAGDFDGDGLVGFPDFLLLSDNYLASNAAASVPEPTGFSILLLTALALIGCVKRRGSTWRDGAGSTPF
jgi:hypothetical protein